MALPAPQDPVDICNLALLGLNQDFVTNIETPTTDTEKLCKKVFPQARRSVLRSHPWNFGIKRAQLAVNATKPLFGFQSAYDLPSDFVRYLTRHTDLGVPVSDGFIEGKEYEIENGQFLTNTTSTSSTVLNIRYIFDQENILKWDPLAIEVLVLEIKLALHIQYKSAPRVIALTERQINEKLAVAKAIDGQERPPRRIQRSKFIQARRRGQSGNVASPFTIFD